MTKKTFEQYGGLISPWVDGLRLKKIARLIPSHSRVLDLGCGPGVLISSLPVDCAYIGVDHDSEIIFHNKKKFPHLFFRELDVASSILPFNDGAFDIVVMAALLEHVKNPRVLLSEVGRVLNSDGCVIATASSFVMTFVQDVLNSIRSLNWSSNERQNGFINKGKLETFLRHTGLALQSGEYFQLGLNQIFILKKELRGE